MPAQRGRAASLIHALLVACTLFWALSALCVQGQSQTGQLSVDASPQNARKISDKMFGVFFEVRVRIQLSFQKEKRSHATISV